MDKHQARVSQVWQILANHRDQIANLNIKEQFTIQPQRFSEFSLKAAGIFLDYSKNRITPETIKFLCNLAEVSEVAKRREEMFSGEKINITENRVVLHTILRNINDQTTPEGRLVNAELKRVELFVRNVHNGKWRGCSGKNITDVVNIGIGGSDLGPAMVVNALQPYVIHNIKLHFVSNLDPTHITETLKPLNPETTLFVIASKTFTTQETLTNANTAKAWLIQHMPNEKDIIAHHFIGVTVKIERAIEFGIGPENIFPFWDWVGGRFSLWSAIGIAIALAIGMDKFYEFLGGAYAMDQHFRTAPIKENMPMILALLSIWNINFLQAESLAIIPYDQYLYLLPAYLQQLVMESNGKHVDINGNPVNYKTAPIVWGAVGTNSQHSFHQLLMQGTHLVPVDFIVTLVSHNSLEEQHSLLYANCLAQSQALMCGCGQEEILLELKKQNLSPKQALNLIPHKMIVGNVPSNTMVIHKLEPKTLGALIALYEHKVFVEGVIWQINSFDQWGVELGKHLANKIVPILEGRQGTDGLDGSTKGLIALKKDAKLI